MGLEAIYPKPKLSQPEEGRRVYPYLLRDVAIERVDHVWSSDNTYIRMARSWLYLVAVIDCAPSGYKCCPDGAQLVISGGGDRLVQPVRVELATGGESGERFLCGGAGRRLAAQPQSPAADFQHGPGLAVYQRGFHWQIESARCGHQHGRSRPLPGQHFYRAAVAQREI